MASNSLFNHLQNNFILITYKQHGDSVRKGWLNDNKSSVASGFSFILNDDSCFRELGSLRDHNNKHLNIDWSGGKQLILFPENLNVPWGEILKLKIHKTWLQLQSSVKTTCHCYPLTS